LNTLSVWSERQRLRVFSSEARAFTYAERLRYHGVCKTCLAKLEHGAAVGDVEHRRAVMSLVAIGIAGGLLAAVLPFLMPTLLSAFWQTR
jgi:hypothetical protein